MLGFRPLLRPSQSYFDDVKQGRARAADYGATGADPAVAFGCCPSEDDYYCAYDYGTAHHDVRVSAVGRNEGAPAHVAPRAAAEVARCAPSQREETSDLPSSDRLKLPRVTIPPPPPRRLRSPPVLKSPSYSSDAVGGAGAGADSSMEPPSSLGTPAAIEAAYKESSSSSESSLDSVHVPGGGLPLPSSRKPRRSSRSVSFSTHCSIATFETQPSIEGMAGASWDDCSTGDTARENAESTPGLMMDCSESGGEGGAALTVVAFVNVPIKDGESASGQRSGLGNVKPSDLRKFVQLIGVIILPFLCVWGLLLSLRYYREGESASNVDILGLTGLDATDNDSATIRQLAGLRGSDAAHFAVVSSSSGP